MNLETDDLPDIAEPYAPETPEQRSERQARELKQIAAVGVWLIHDLQDQAQKPKDERPSHAELSLAFHRYSRAVRLTHLLENRIWAKDQAIALLKPAEPKPKSRADRRRQVVCDLVDQTVQVEAEREPLFDAKETWEEAERLIEEELEDEDIEGRPIQEVYALICSTLGLKPKWSLWDPRHWRDPKWGLAEDELSDAACPEGPPKRLADDWPEPGTLFPLPLPPSPSPSPSGSSRGPIGEPVPTLDPRDKPEDDARGVRDREPKTFKGPP